MGIDFGKTANDYAIHRVPFAPRLFERLKEFGVGTAGQHLLDLGAGTGLFACAIAEANCRVVQVDLSAELLRQSPLSAAVIASSSALPFAEQSFDVVTAAQCWHWFDRQAAPLEILRILRPGAALAVVYQTYIPLPGSVAEATEKLILRHRPRWRHANSTGINGQALRDMQIAGFVDIESFSFDVPIDFTHDSWRGFIRTTSPVGASMNSDQLAKFDCEHATMLQDWPQQLQIPHRVFAAIARSPHKLST